MRKILQITVLAAMTLLLGNAAMAGNPTTSSSKGGDSHRGQFEKLVKELGLTEQQAVAVKQAMENHRKAMEKWKTENGPTIEQLRKQLEAAKKSGDESTLSGLKEKMEKIHASRKTLVDNLTAELGKTLSQEQMSAFKQKLETDSPKAGAKNQRPADHIKMLAEKLKLTEEQKTQAKAILDAAAEKAQQASPEERKKIIQAAMEEVKKTVLTDEQRNKLNAAEKEYREEKGGPFSKLNLSDEQKNKIKTIIEEAKSKASSASSDEEKRAIIGAAHKKICNEVLTEDQRAALEKNRKCKDAPKGAGGSSADKKHESGEGMDKPPGE